MSHEMNKEPKRFSLQKAFWGSLIVGSVALACAEDRREDVYNQVIAQDRSVTDIYAITAAGDKQLAQDTVYQVLDNTGAGLVLATLPIGFAWGFGAYRRRKEEAKLAPSV